MSSYHFLVTVVFVFGTIIGSFLNVCIVRLPKGESLIQPPSHCPGCRTPIPFYDNVPLLSYLWLRGRCRFCKIRISPRYFLVELLTGILSVALAHRFGLGMTFISGLVFGAGLIVITFIDLHVRIVPDVISLPGIGFGLLAAIINRLVVKESFSFLPSPVSSLGGILLGGGVLLLVAWGYERVTKTEGMGGGDIKLLAMIGAFLGWPAIPVVLFVASFTGSILGLILILQKKATGKLALPFAPFLCGAAFVHLFYGEKIISFYFRF